MCHNQVVLPIVKARLAKKRGESYNQALTKEIVKNSIPGQLTRACYDTGKKAYLMAGGIDSSGEPDSQIKGLRRDNQYL